MKNKYNHKGGFTQAPAFKKSGAGFTLIEILVVIGIIAVLAAIVIIAINPSRQFAIARNSQRTSNVSAILNSVGQRMADNKGLFRALTDATCQASMDIPVTAVDRASAVRIANAGGVDMRPCLVSTYISELPVDPSNGVPFNAGVYDTDYWIYRDAAQRVTVCAPTLEASVGNPEICITR